MLNKVNVKDLVGKSNDEIIKFLYKEFDNKPVNEQIKDLEPVHEIYLLKDSPEHAGAYNLAVVLTGALFIQAGFSQERATALMSRIIEESSKRYLTLTNNASAKTGSKPKVTIEGDEEMPEEIGQIIEAISGILGDDCEGIHVVRLGGSDSDSEEDQSNTSLSVKELKEFINKHVSKDDQKMIIENHPNFLQLDKEDLLILMATESAAAKAVACNIFEAFLDEKNKDNPDYEVDRDSIINDIRILTQDMIESRAIK